jgi:hypothetical protein
MGTDGKCPRCAYKAPILCFYQEAKDGRILAAYAKLPGQVQVHYFGYLSLFRPASGTAMQSAKAARLTLELADEVAKGFISRQGQVDRSAAPRIWGMAMEQMMERSGSLTLPVKTHGYLKTIVYDIANKENAGQEQTTRSAEARGQSPVRETMPSAEKRRRDLDAKWEKEQKEWDEENAKKLEKVSADSTMKGTD